MREYDKIRLCRKFNLLQESEILVPARIIRYLRLRKKYNKRHRSRKNLSIF